MIALAVETSSARGSAALSPRDGSVLVRGLEGTRGRGRDLAPALRSLLDEAGLRARDLELVAVGIGPGGYTGVRLALATVRGLAFALGVPIVGVESTRVLACHPDVPPGAERVLVVLDARRGDVYAALYERRGGGAEPREIVAPRVEPAGESARRVDRATFVVGDGLALLEKAAGRALAGDADLAPRASDLLGLALRRAAEGRTDDPFRLAPLYLRPSEAERRWRLVDREGDAP